jgi:hypothetical protein
MRKYFVLAMALFVVPFSFSQITEGEKELRDVKLDSLEGWKTGGLISINGSQVSLTNWNAGGQNSISINGLVSMYANLRKGKSEWENSMDLGYGILRQGRKDNVSWIKTDDKIDVVSKYGRKASDKWFYSALFEF